MKGLFVFKSSGVQQIFYGPITQQMVDLAPNYFKGVSKPYPWTVRTYSTKTMYHEAVVTKEEVNAFEKKLKTDPVPAYPFSTPTPQLVAHLSLLSPSARKKFSAAWFDEQKTGFNGFLKTIKSKSKTLKTKK